MKELALIYDALASNYAQLFARVNDQDSLMGFTASDFFSPEPFFHELNHIQDESVQIYLSQEELPDAAEPHMVSILDGRLEFARNFCAEDIYYDSFFVYTDNEKTRYLVYVNAGEVKPIKIEKLISHEDKLPHIYKEYSEYGYQCFAYAMIENKMIVERQYFDLKETLTFQDKLEVTYTDGMAAVEKIIQITDKSIRQVYDAKAHAGDLSDLLTQAQAFIVNTIISESKKQTVPEEVECILLEYCMQGPFPPTIGFGLSREKEQYESDDEDPLLFYNAADMEYFSEGENIEINLHSAGTAMFDEINSQLDGLDYDKAGAMVASTYVEICKKLKRSQNLKKNIQVSPNFHVTARDFEVCNEWEILQQVLTKKALQKLKKKVDAHKEQAKFSPEDTAFLVSLEALNDEKIQDYNALKQAINDVSIDDFYSPDELYFFEPFHHEIHLQALSYYASFRDNPGLSRQAETDCYYHYRLDNNRIIYSAYHHGPKLIKEFFYLYEEDKVSEYYFHHDDETLLLENYSVLKTQDGQPIKYTAQSRHRFNEYDFTINSKGLVAAATENELRLSVEHNLKMERKLQYRYYYDDHNNLTRITHVYISLDDKVSSGLDGDVVDFCSDNSYLDEALEQAVSTNLEEIFLTLNKENLTDACALVLERSDNLPLPTREIHLLYKDGSNIEWQGIDAYNRSYRDAQIYFNFSAYISRSQAGRAEDDLSEHDAINYVDMAFSRLGLALKERVKQEFGFDLCVLEKLKADSIEKINARFRG